MKWVYLYSTVLLFITCKTSFGQTAWGIAYQHGYNVPAYERSPETTRTSPFLSGIYQISGDQIPSLSEFYGSPDFNIQAFYQNLGNDDVMGFALGVVPELRFVLGRKKRGTWYLGGGLGAAWVNRPFDKVTNPLNQALGTPWNIYAQAAVEYRRQWGNGIDLGFEFAIHHLSNSFFSFPNLGVNIPHVGITLYRQNTPNPEVQRTAIDTSRLQKKSGWRPFVRWVYGITERSYDGPKFAILGAGLGMYKRVAPHRTFLLGAEYMFDESSYYFVSRASGQDGEEIRQQARRYLLFAGHEFHFGYAAFVTEAGVYLSEQFNRQSIISAKVGFNFYPWNLLYRNKNQLSIGIFIRAYFLRADFFEINANYRF